MNNKVAEVMYKIENGVGLLRFETRIYRPFITTTIIQGISTDGVDAGYIFGIGTSCVQLPDKWDIEQGTKTSKIRAVKQMLGIENPRLVNVIAHENTRAVSA